MITATKSFTRTINSNNIGSKLEEESNEQKMVENIIFSCTKINFKKKIAEIIGSKFKVQRNNLFISFYSRFEIYSLFCVYTIVYEKNPCSVIQLNKFVKENYGQNYDILENEEYFNEFAASNFENTISGGGQKYNLKYLRNVLNLALSNNLSNQTSYYNSRDATLLTFSRDTTDCIKSKIVEKDNNSFKQLNYKKLQLSDLGIDIIHIIYKYLSNEAKVNFEKTNRQFKSLRDELRLKENINEINFNSLLTLLKSNHHSIRLLNLIGVDLSKADSRQNESRFSQLCNILDQIPTIKVLNVSECKIKDLLSEINVISLKHITYLDVSHNQIGDQEVKYIGELIGLNKLIIFYNQIGADGAKCISRLSRLSKLNIFHNRIEEKGVEYISTMTRLIYLNISSNDVNDKGAEFISKLTNLTELYIFNNKIGEKGAEYVSRLPKLTKLNISHNHIGMKGSEYISKMSRLAYRVY